MSTIETRYWVIGYASDQGAIGWEYVQVQVPQPVPASPVFWRHCRRLIRGKVPGSDMIALTPLSGPLEPED